MKYIKLGKRGIDNTLITIAIIMLVLVIMYVLGRGYFKIMGVLS